ncbi:MAG: hypothetical protein QUS33_10220 [Dehalococcoidia bacterium]|nr:hypothetical protein [Dehalococcoidia bacterium]
MKSIGRRTCLAVGIICLLLLAAALLIARNSPATGYELSVYASTPTLVWVFLLLAVVGGLFIIVHQVVTEDCESSRVWLAGFLVLLLAHVSLICVPYVRGYTTWFGDNLSHWGHIKDILSAGHFTKFNSYPVTHVMLAQVVLVTGLPLSGVANLSTCFLSLGFVLSAYLLATAVLQDRGQQLLVAAVVAAVMPFGLYHVLLMPNGWSILLFPLLLFAALKCEGLAYLVVALFMVVLYPFFHPLSSLMVAAALVTIVLLTLALRYVFGRPRKAATAPPLGRILTLAAINLAILLPWLLSFEEHVRRERLLWHQLLTGGADVIGSMGESLEKVDVHGLGFLILLVKMYGVELILIGAALIGGILLMRQLRSAARDVRSLGLLSLLGLMLLFGSLYLLYLVGTPGLGAIGGTRLLSYTMIPTAFLSAFCMHHFVTRRHGPRVAMGVLCVIILPAILSMLSLYDSPYRLRPNIQVTETEMAGMEWFIETKDRSLGSTYIMRPPDRFAHALLGYEESQRRRSEFSSYAPQIPDHFGYGEFATLGDQYTRTTYAAITRFDTVVYSTVWRKVGRFTQADFEQLQEDATVTKIYANGGLDVYLIRGLGAAP